MFSRERVKPCVFVTFNNIHKAHLSWKFIEIPYVVPKIWRFSPSRLTIFIDFSDFLTFPCCKETNDVTYNRWCQQCFYIQVTLNRLFNNCIELYSYQISSSWNMKGRGVKLIPPRKKLPSKSPLLLGLRRKPE